MAKTKKSRKEIEKTSTKNIIKLLDWRKVTIVVVVLGIFLWVADIERPFYSINETDAKTQMTSFLGKIQPSSGKLVYSIVANQGCSDAGSVGLAKRTTCSLIGYRYYEVQQADAKSVVESVNSTIVSGGWPQDGVSPSEDTGQILGGTHGGTIYYSFKDKSQAGPDYGIDAGVYISGDQSSDTTIQELIGEGKISAPSPGEAVIGLDVSQIYWSCDEDHLYQLPCPEPPYGEITIPHY